MINFCTLFNSYYLQKGIATYLSLEKVTDEFHIYVMAFDKECYESLKSYGFNHMTVELLDDFETPELLAVKAERNMAEYCWTCSAAITYYFVNKYKLPSITYLDADLYFIHNPKILIEEIGDASVGLSEHWFGYKNERAGRFCVQFVYFKNDNEGMSALKYWKDSCINWCFARYEDGKYGDQTYIEDIYKNYKNVHVIEHRGCGLAPWNYNIYNFPDAETLEYEDKKYPVVFFHFHGVKFLRERTKLVMTSGDGSIAKNLSKLFYHPYLLLILHIYNKYLGANYNDIEIRDIPLSKKIYNKLKHSLHDNPIAKFFYYKVFDVRYNGYDKKK
ncbi:hypothetical protein [Macellibacteroides fermentans]|uniref:Glycosyl transferase family 8 n=1 Tax=Parabacteroides chartae TaxID=1037355 RepID=A0A1T5AP35_9BACT|nr:hypothetical protein [Parabacteroides chartae]SKB36609.1 hypothetical protein SAMN05660349_00776 [Parabacteroides chartae]